MNQELNPRPRQRRYDARRREILRTAAAAFARKGFSAATMEEIGEALDMTKGSLYYYFNSKQDLLYFCQKYSLERLEEEARAVIASGASAPEQLYRLILSQITCMLDELQGSAAHLEFRSLPSPQLEEIIRRRDRYEAVLRGVVESGIRSGHFHDSDPRFAVWAILGAVNWTAQWFRPAGPLRAEEVGRHFATFLVRGLTRPRYHHLIPASQARRKSAS